MRAVRANRKLELEQELVHHLPAALLGTGAARVAWGTGLVADEDVFCGTGHFA